MCGILAQVCNRQPIDERIFLRMRDTLAHRGPDDADTWTSSDGMVALGHRRLAIIDLSKLGRQPLSNEDGTIWLSYNGEIYNFQELRSTLESNGHRFRSHTDSEVIVHAYEEWGESCVNRFLGMFAFVIWDDGRQLLFGARDRLGVKPLHFSISESGFICASEIKAIVEHPDVPRILDQSAICDYLTYRYIPSPKTIWKSVRKLPPAHTFTYRNGTLRTRRYWTLEQGDTVIPKTDAVEQLAELLEDSVKIRLISDVPLGVFLSGGLDSSAIAWQMGRIADRVDSFTIGFGNGEKDETSDAAQMAEHLKTNHHAEILSESELENLSTLLWYFDEPFGASSMCPTFLVSRIARRNVTVALSGDGGDEALAGYNWYDSLLGIKPNFLRQWMYTQKRRWQPAKERLAERYRQTTTPRFQRNQLHQLFSVPLTHLEDDELWFFEQAIRPDLNGVKQLQWLDTHTFLPEESLTKVDRASMANSLEVRSPFLDHRLFEWTFSLDEAVYFGGIKKHLLKELLKHHLPERTIDKPKRGFSAPVNLYWNDVRCNQVLRESRAVADGLLNSKFMDNLIHQRDDRAIRAQRWLLTVFELWYRKWCV
ncbi:MAG TPA: asparagine synthase (glutamine-hydrolyzing) [Candidatus Latescibacteria bacterium]|nr:asparagine synthase (glutamine-hydrolyzing) [Candidatus Latescibacterota bacterium]